MSEMHRSTESGGRRPALPRRLDRIRSGLREWQHTFDAIGDPIAVFDREGTLLRGNSALAQVLGQPPAALRRAACREVGFCSGAFPRCAVGDAARRGATGRAEMTRADGQIFSVTTFPVTSGSDAAVVQVAQNVTEEMRSARRLRQMSVELAAANARLTTTVERLKSTQAQLLQAEKLSAIGQLVAGVAHELNNPLTSVIGFAQLLEEELRGVPPAPPRPAAALAQDLRQIGHEAERAARIIRNLLAFARRQAVARAPQDVVELVSRVLSLRSYELRLSAIEVQTTFAPNLPPIMADGGHIQQALLNLVLNAEQAMRGLAVRRLNVAARFDEPASAIELSVSDTGHGIDPARLTRIFDPFFTTRPVGEGAGLGLSICYGVVRDHGGQMAVNSAVEIGTTVSILLPTAATEPSSLSSEQVLVAHPEPDERDFASAALVAWGWTVASTASASEALERYRAGGLHALVVDRVLLAQDPAGWWSAREEDHRRTPMVLVAGPGDESEVDRFARDEACVVLTPPFQLRALRSAIGAAAKECV